MHTYKYIYIHIHMYTAVYIHIVYICIHIVYICAYTCNIHLYTYIYIHILTWAGRKLTYDGVLTHIVAKGRGGVDHPTASDRDIRVRLQPESCRLADSPGVGRLDSEVAWTSLRFGRSSSGSSRANLIYRVEQSRLTRYHQLESGSA
jgi:hypothetical protein